MKFETDKTNDHYLFNFSYRDLVENESSIWLYIDLFNSMDLSDFEAAYNEEGQVPKDPKLMLRTIFYGLTHGVVSGHKLQDACKYDNRFIVLSGDLRPDRRTFDRFLDRHYDNIEKLFVKVVKIAKEMGLVNLGRIAIDGSRFKANTSTHKSMKYGKMNKAIEYIKEDLKKLKEDLKKENAAEQNIESTLEKEIQDKERRLERIEKAKKKIEEEYEIKKNKSKEIDECRKSLNDIDAQSLAHKSSMKGYSFGYNVQTAVEDSNQIIVSAEIHDKATDYESMPILLDKIAEDYEDKPEELLADLGYKSAKNLNELETREITGYIATGSNEYNEVDVQFSEQVEATDEEHVYKCLNKKELPIAARRKDGRTEVKICKEFCDGCCHRQECRAFGKKTITIMKEEDRLRMNKLLARSRTDEFKSVYKKRKTIVEPVFANIKNKGIKILVVGKQKVKRWFKLACTAHNIEKVINHMAINNKNNKLLCVV